MVVRELIGLLKIKTDEKSVKKAESGMAKMVKNAAGIIAKVSAAYAGARGVLAIIEMASDANETLNVLNESFHENIEVVKQWAKDFGKEAGRSEYAMRDIAGQFGAVLNPMLEGNSEAAADMSAGLAELVVDLGSFFNAAETDVLESLRSGLIGLPQAMFKFGVVMRQANLETFRLKLGIKKTYQEMTQAEKTTLRYKFILDATKNAQGDAARTAGGWANKTKNLGAQLKDVGTRIGLTFLPAAEALLGVLMSLVEAFVTIGEAIYWVWNQLEPAAKNMILLGAAIRVVQVALTSGPIAAFALLIVLIALIIDDIRTFGEGGESVIGDFMDSLNGFHLLWEEIRFAINEAWQEVKKFWDLLMKAPDKVLDKIFGEGSAAALGAAFGGAGVPAPRSQPAPGDNAQGSKPGPAAGPPGQPGPWVAGGAESANRMTGSVFGDRNVTWDNKISITVAPVGDNSQESLETAVNKIFDKQVETAATNLESADPNG